jgi:hypothetical protein
MRHELVVDAAVVLDVVNAACVIAGLLNWG